MNTIKESVIKAVRKLPLGAWALAGAMFTGLCLTAYAQLYQFNDAPQGGAGNNTPINSGSLTNFGGTNVAVNGTGTNISATNMVIAGNSSTNFVTQFKIHQGVANAGGVLGGTGVSLFPSLYELNDAGGGFTGSVTFYGDLNTDGTTGQMFTTTHPLAYTFNTASNYTSAVPTNTAPAVGDWVIAASNIANSDWIQVSITNSSSNKVVIMGIRASYNMPQ